MTLEQVVEGPITFTNEAAAKIRAFAKELPEAQGKLLRVGIQGGGCSGFQYALDYDDPRDTDTRYEHNGVAYLLDPVSERFVAGTQIDYVNTIRGQGFAFSNPNAKASCGCGHSFTMDW